MKQTEIDTNNLLVEETENHEDEGSITRKLRGIL